VLKDRYISATEIAELTGASRKTVWRTLKEMEEIGWLEKVSRKWRAGNVLLRLVKEAEI